MTVFWSSLAGGLLGTLTLTTILRAASEMGLTRMDLPFLLGTTVTENRRRAKVYGYLFHFGLGLSFAVLYGLSFAAIGRSSWWLGALIEPPGFLMLNYGRNTFLLTLAAHAAYGAIIGWAVRLAA